MKPFFAVCGLLLLGLLPSAQACDVCSCGSGGGGHGGLQGFQRGHFIGLRWQYQAFRSPYGGSAEGLGQATTRDVFHSLVLSGQYQISDAFFVRGALPLAWQSRKVADQSTTRSGLSDGYLMAGWTAFKTPDTALANIYHSLQVMGGLKLPMGQFRGPEAGEVVNPSFQLGTGSLDYMGQLAYRADYLQWSLAALASYRYTTTNRHDYRFGDRLEGGIQVSRAFQPDFYSLKLLPSIGLSSTHYAKDVRRSREVERSGGQVHWWRAGLQVRRNQWALGFQASLPLYSRMAGGTVEVEPAASVNLSMQL